MTTTDWIIIVIIVVAASAASLFELMRANTQRVIEARRHDREIAALSDRVSALEDGRGTLP